MPIKFTKAQLAFLSIKFPDLDKEEFIKEALEYEPEVKPKRVAKEVPEEERCCAMKKDGQQCTKRHSKEGTMCAVHERQAAKQALLQEISV